jgi:tetratricopeptide (TPR) repeat protein
MIRSVSRTIRKASTPLIAAQALLLALLLAGTGPVQAQSSACGEKRDVKQGALDEMTWKRLNEAYELVGSEDYDGAYAKLVQIGERARSDYLKAIVAQGIAQVEWSRGNYDESLRQFERAVEINALPDKTHYQLMYQIAQLYYMKERFKEALAKLDLWFCKVPEEQHVASAYVLKASIYSQTQNWPEVLKAIETAIAMSEEPEENWYLLKLAAHYEMEDWPKVADTLTILVSQWPDKKQYWTQLSNVYVKLQEDDKALSTIALAYRKNLLNTESDLLYLANLYSFRDLPYKSALVMEKGMNDGIISKSEKHWTVTGDNFYAAEEMEKALESFEKAGELADSGKIDLRRGFILIDQERWQDASAALSSAIEKGGMSDTQTGEAHLMHGMAQFQLGNYDRASASWGRASRYEKTRKDAQQWMNHMREERARKSAAL